MWVCAGCGQQVAAQAAFCTNCGRARDVGPAPGEAVAPGVGAGPAGNASPAAGGGPAAGDQRWVPSAAGWAAEPGRDDTQVSAPLPAGAVPPGAIPPADPSTSGPGRRKPVGLLVALGALLLLAGAGIGYAAVNAFGEDDDGGTAVSTETSTSTTSTSSTTVAETTTTQTTSTTTTVPATTTTVTPTTSAPTTPPVIPAGAFCRDLAAAGRTYAQAVAYWDGEGRPDRMDADLNGIPCETVYPPEVVAAYWRPVTPPSQVATLPDGLFCKDLKARAFTYGDAVAYWYTQDFPDRMDADRNGIPCETVYSPAEVSAHWG